MPDFLMLENELVNLDHIVRAKFSPAYAGGEEDEEVPGLLTNPHPATLELTLTSVHIDGGIETAASQSDLLLLAGERAERAWGILNVWKKQAERKRYIADE